MLSFTRGQAVARLAEQDGLRGALVSIDAMPSTERSPKPLATPATCSLEANQPGLRAEVVACFATAPSGSVETHTTHDKGHGRIARRTVGAGQDGCR